MVVVQSGEKFACKQCIQGHRVSSCTHAERSLIHVKKKGRPVSQCLRCRTLRKSYRRHVKCTCGQEQEERENSASLSDHSSTSPKASQTKKPRILKTEDSHDHNYEHVDGEPRPSTRTSGVQIQGNEGRAPQIRTSTAPDDFNSSVSTCDQSIKSDQRSTSITESACERDNYLESDDGTRESDWKPLDSAVRWESEPNEEGEILLDLDSDIYDGLGLDYSSYSFDFYSLPIQESAPTTRSP